MNREQMIKRAIKFDFERNRRDGDFTSPFNPEDMADFAIEQMQALQAENAELREACQIVMEACQDNLKKFAYKNEQALLTAYEACESALQEAE